MDGRGQDGTSGRMWEKHGECPGGGQPGHQRLLLSQAWLVGSLEVGRPSLASETSEPECVLGALWEPSQGSDPGM